MKLRFTRQAKQDLDNIADYVREQNPEAALRVRAAIVAIAADSCPLSSHWATAKVGERQKAGHAPLQVSRLLRGRRIRRRDRDLDDSTSSPRTRILRRLRRRFAKPGPAYVGIFTTTLIASSMRSRAYLMAVGTSPSPKVWVWISLASKRFWAISAAARWVALLPSPRMPKT